MSNPDNRKYCETHEWLLAEGDLITLGITQFAADELTDITYVELPQVGLSLSAGDAVAEVESVKATSEIFSAVDGEVVEVNAALADHPELINDDPFNEGWIVKIKATSTEPLASLLTAQEYEAQLSS